MTATVETSVISEPGVYQLDAATYHRDPVPGGSLSASGAKKLLPPSCPAIYRWERDHGEPPRDVFDFGTAAHRQVLGVGAQIIEVHHQDWRTKDAHEQQKAARAAGATPLLSRDCRTVEQMAKVLREHPTASALLDPDRGKPEQSFVWRDEQHGVWRRAMIDFLPAATARRAMVVDYKTCVSADRDAISKAVANYGYALQAAWYLDGVRALELDDDPAFLLIFQMKTAPYLIAVVQVDGEAMRYGQRRCQDALAIYAECVSTDTWPGFTDPHEVELVSLPPWLTNL